MKYLKQTLFYSGITLVFILAGIGLYQTFWAKPKQPLNAKVYPVLKPVGSFSLQEGESPFTEQNFNGRWSFVFFGYTYCPDVCPTTMAALAEFYRQLPESVRKDTQIILVSVDPERDNPVHLQEYASAFNPNFKGITGAHSQLDSFARQFGAVFYQVGEGDDYLVDHTAKIFLINPRGQRHAFFDKTLDNPTAGFEFNIPQMVNDYLVIRENFVAQ
jgi:protein SCO1/2